MQTRGAGGIGNRVIEFLAPCRDCFRGRRVVQQPRFVEQAVFRQGKFIIQRCGGGVRESIGRSDQGGSDRDGGGLLDKIAARCRRRRNRR